MRRFILLLSLLALMFSGLFLAIRHVEDGGDTATAVEDQSTLVDSRTYPIWMDEVITPPSSVKPADVFTFTCEFPTQKPAIFTTACADFGEMVRDVTWENWNIDRPLGKGIYSLNDCKPNCAEGTRNEIPVRVWLEDVITDGKNYFFNTLKMVPLKAFEGSIEYARNPDFWLYNEVEFEGKTYLGAIWDVSRDWKEFPEMREELPD